MSGSPELFIQRGASHPVRCPWCDASFDLFAAPWCAHAPEPSKFCPSCGHCLCEHPGYRNPWMWREAPEGLRRRGIDRLFVLYL